MKKASIFISILVLSLITPAAWGQTLGAVLTGAQEVPGPGDPDGFGTATFTFSSDRTQITVDSRFTGIGTAITGAHIHKAPAGASAGVLVGFVNAATTITTGRINTTVAVNPADANDMIANPSGYYFNIHTPAHGPGAIRGQLTSTSAAVFVGDMKAEREVPTPGPPGGSGSFVVSFNEARDRVDWAIAVEGIGADANLIAAHIHSGVEGVAGPIEVGFSPTFVNGRASGSVAVSPSLANAIISNPAGFYVNVHTTAFPGGAVRGQLIASSTGNTVFLPVIGRVSNATETFVTDVRIFNPSFTQTATVLVEFFKSDGTTHTATLTIPPRGTAVLNDIVGNRFMTTGIGGARITSATRVVASSRIFSDRRQTGGGTVGQFFQGVTQPLRRGILTQISQFPGTGQPGSSATRTNIGLFNQNDVTVTVRLELRDTNGNVAASTVLNLAPHSFRQDALDIIFGNPGMILADGTVTFDASAPILVYASVVDNVTTDPLAVLPVEDTDFPIAP